MPNVLPVLRRAFDRARPALLAASLFVGFAILLLASNQYERIPSWIFWKYAGIWLWTAVFTCACLFAGHALLHHVPGLNLRLRERLLFDFAVGVFVFGTGIFLCGVCRLLRGPFYFLYPAVLTAAGASTFVPYLRRAFRYARHVPRRPASFSALRIGAGVLGTLGTTLIYLCVMTPQNLSFDARTYHIPLA